MDDRLVGAFDRAAPNPIAQAQVLVVPHPRGMGGVVLNEGVQGRPAGLGSLQVLSRARTSTRRRVVREARAHGLPGASLLKLQAGVGPACSGKYARSRGSTDVREERGAVPDPRPVSHDHHDGVGRSTGVQCAQRRAKSRSALPRHVTNTRRTPCRSGESATRSAGRAARRS